MRNMENLNSKPNSEYLGLIMNLKLIIIHEIEYVLVEKEFRANN